jgi:hypothetical protein
MASDDDLDVLMTAYCEGLYAMDPRTTYPFWDYDFAPLFSKTWMDKMLAATAACDPVSVGTYARLFGGPSVPRKELIYSLFDMKVARVAQRGRLRQANFWIDILKSWCGDDWLSNGSNRAPDLDNPEAILVEPNWVTTDRAGGIGIGRMVATLNALAYGLYSDVFVHQCAECRGPYDFIPQIPTGRNRRLLIRSWSGLRPYRLHPECQDPGFDQIVIGAIYDCDFEIDIYNHVTWDEPPIDHVDQYAVWLDKRPTIIEPEGLSALAHRIAQLAETTFRDYQDSGFEEKKLLWVRQRNYQFRKFFAFTNLPECAPEMEAAVLGKPLQRSPIWNMSLPKDQIFLVWKQCLDPRTEIYDNDWPTIFHEAFGAQRRP